MFLGNDGKNGFEENSNIDPNYVFTCSKFSSCLSRFNGNGERTITILTKNREIISNILKFSNFFDRFEKTLKKMSKSKKEIDDYLSIISKLLTPGLILSSNENKKLKELLIDNNFLFYSKNKLIEKNDNKELLKNGDDLLDEYVYFDFDVNRLIDLLEDDKSIFNMYYKDCLFSNLDSSNFVDKKQLEKLVNNSNGIITRELLGKFTKIVDGKVEGIYWDGHLDLSSTNIHSLRKIKSIKNLFAVNSNLEDLGHLSTVGELHIRNTKISTLGNLLHANFVFADFTGLESLGMLKSAYEVFAIGTPLNDLGYFEKGTIHLSKISTFLKMQRLVRLEDAKKIKFVKH